MAQELENKNRDRPTVSVDLSWMYFGHFHLWEFILFWVRVYRSDGTRLLFPHRNSDNTKK